MIVEVRLGYVRVIRNRRRKGSFYDSCMSFVTGQVLFCYIVMVKAPLKV